MGGAVATSAGGLRGAKYGTMKHYVLGLEVVLPTGEVVRTGARTRKSVTGYDLTSLLVGTTARRVLPRTGCDVMLIKDSGD